MRLFGYSTKTRMEYTMATNREDIMRIWSIWGGSRDKAHRLDLPSLARDMGFSPAIRPLEHRCARRWQALDISSRATSSSRPWPGQRLAKPSTTRGRQWIHGCHGLVTAPSRCTERCVWGRISKYSSRPLSLPLSFGFRARPPFVGSWFWIDSGHC